MTAADPAGEPRASIEDLLQHEEEPPAPPRPARSGLGWVVRTTLYSAGLAALGVFALRVFGVRVPVLLALTLAYALLALRRVVRQVAVPRLPEVTGARPSADPMADDGSYQWSGGDGQRAAVGRWEYRLEACQGDPQRFARTVVPMLADLVDERLRQRHGLTRASDPDRARALLGEPLWTFLATPVTRSPAPQDLAAMVGHMEAI